VEAKKYVYLAGTTNTTQPIRIKMIIRYNTRWRDDGEIKQFDRVALLSRPKNRH